MKEEIRWTRLAAEGAVIVASILLAFAVDAGWSTRQERQREAATLSELAGDFERHQAILRRSVESFERRLEAADRLLASIGPAAEADGPTVLAALGVVGVASPVRFQGGTLETLTSTDGLSLLRDEELRTNLARWRQALDELESINTFVIAEAHSLLDYLRPRFSIQDMDRAAGLSDAPPSGFDPDVTGLLRDLEFSNLVYQQRFATEVLLAYLAMLAEISDRVLAGVDR